MRVLTAFVLLLLALAPARADVGAGEQQAIRTVIETQLRAFQADDGNTAFSFASPILQQYFGDPQTFMQMVQQGYDPVYRPREVEFQDLELRGDTVIQKVLFVDRNGKAFLARYSMQQQEDGSWRINGVWLEALPDVST